MCTEKKCESKLSGWTLLTSLPLKRRRWELAGERVSSFPLTQNSLNITLFLSSQLLNPVGSSFN
jgi:hypothetical protein